MSSLIKAALAGAKAKAKSLMLVFMISITVMQMLTGPVGDAILWAINIAGIWFFFRYVI